MTAGARLGGFAAGLAVAFGAAVAVGTAVDTQRGHDAGAAPKRAGMAGMGSGAHGGAAADAPRGLAVADGRLRLVADRTILPAGQTRPFTFRIVDAHGATVRAFDVQHARRLHLIAVRRDLTGYQHLHPTQAADGSWSVPLRLAQPGAYRVYADFRADGSSEPTTLATDVLVAGDFRPRALPAAATRVRVDGYDVTLRGAARAGRESDVAFTVTRGGRPVAVQPYLGADGHLVALRDGDLAYLHVHPDGGAAARGRIAFMTEVPSAGRYRLFLQFRAGGTVHTAAFTQEVAA